MLQAPEDGYASRIEAGTPEDLRERYFYFKTYDGKYGKIHIDNIDASDRLLVGFDYYIQPDGTRDLATEVSLAPENTDTTPPVTTNDYRFDGVWKNQDTTIFWSESENNL